jgi:hypothetical protein
LPYGNSAFGGKPLDPQMLAEAVRPHRTGALPQAKPTGKLSTIDHVEAPHPRVLRFQQGHHEEALNLIA